MDCPRCASANAPGSRNCIACGQGLGPGRPVHLATTLPTLRASRPSLSRGLRRRLPWAWILLYDLTDRDRSAAAQRARETWARTARAVGFMGRWPGDPRLFALAVASAVPGLGQLLAGHRQRAAVFGCAACAWAAVVFLCRNHDFSARLGPLALLVSYASIFDALAGFPLGHRVREALGLRWIRAGLGAMCVFAVAAAAVVVAIPAFFDLVRLRGPGLGDRYGAGTVFLLDRGSLPLDRPHRGDLVRIRRRPIWHSSGSMGPVLALPGESVEISGDEILAGGKPLDPRLAAMMGRVVCDRKTLALRSGEYLVGVPGWHGYYSRRARLETYLLRVSQGDLDARAVFFLDLPWRVGFVPELHP